MPKQQEININSTFNNVFCNGISTYYRFLPIFRKLLDFHKLCLIFRKKYSLQLDRFQF